LLEAEAVEMRRKTLALLHIAEAEAVAQEDTVVRFRANLQEAEVLLNLL
jgi:hypothetical protein